MGIKIEHCPSCVDKAATRKNLVPNCMSYVPETGVGFQRQFLVHVSLALDCIFVQCLTARRVLWGSYGYRAHIVESGKHSVILNLLADMLTFCPIHHSRGRLFHFLAQSVVETKP